jgi:hypothetical protein
MLLGLKIELALFEQKGYLDLQQRLARILQMAAR